MRRASPSPFLLAPVPHAVLSLASLLSAVALGPAFVAPARAQSPDVRVLTDVGTPLSIKATPMLAEKPPEGPGNEVPVFVFGDSLSGRPDLEIMVNGDAELRRGPTAIRADRVEYYQPEDTVKATGNVRISSSGNQYRGPALQIKLETFEGFFTQPSYRFLARGGNGQASRIDFIDDKRLVAYDATFTTCERDDETTWQPAWVLTGSRFKFDQEAQTGEATNAVLRFKGVPILAIPSLSFPLSDKRKSGFLPPSFGLDSTSGTLFTQPYYFDIAPNRDATFSPTVMTKRGLNLGGEYRYLEPGYAGKLVASLMPGDKLRNINRWSYSLQHTGSIDSGLSAIGPLGLNANLNRVSDDNYWRDFPASGSSLTQRLLVDDVSLNWSRGYFATSLRSLRWQTLQDMAAPIVPPYNRLPQLTASYTRINAPVGGLIGLSGLSGFDWSVDSDYTHFSADRKLTGQPNAERLVARAQLSRPWISPGWYVTPRLQLNATSYSFDTPLANGRVSASRILPTFSLDSGLQFERKANFLGRDFTQTLEPRAFYVRTPYRDQSLLPNYDSGANDFNFATVFTENSFTGNDRISDANLLTLGVTSRLLDPATGAEAVRVGVAQRLGFEDQKVTLPGVLPASNRVSDLLFGTTINWDPQWSLDGTVQYNPKARRSERSVLGVRYMPGNYHVISASIRRQRNVSNLIDVSTQWPLNDLWGDKGRDLGAGQGQGGGRYYGVGRLNYSVLDKKLVDGVIGLEYDGCCWIGRVVLQRSQSSAALSNTRILFQLELVGFSRIGSNPLETLRSNIPRYQSLRDQVSTPSRFTNYD